jgi:hypothetical protein
MRLFIECPNEDAERCLDRAMAALQKAGIGGQGGGFIGKKPIVIIRDEAAEEAIKVLTRAGVVAIRG